MKTFIFFFSQPILMALALTLTIELIVLFLFKIRKVSVFLIMFLVNCFTNVSMNLLLEAVPYQQDTLYLGIAEIVVFVVEGLILAILLKNRKLGFLISFVANSLSLLIGLILLPLFY